jgi:SP family sugar:H+ symporter-like MFS transporter
MDEARGVLVSVGQDASEEQLATIRHSIEGERAQKVRDRRGPKPGLLPVVWVGLIPSALQQFVGINVIFYYSSML